MVKFTTSITIMRLSALGSVTADYINHHAGCEPWCLAPTCNQFPSQCSSCSFCKGPQRMQAGEDDEPPERTWSPVATKSSAKVRLEGERANITHFWDRVVGAEGWQGVYT